MIKLNIHRYGQIFETLNYYYFVQKLNSFSSTINRMNCNISSVTIGISNMGHENKTISIAIVPFTKM